MYSDIAVLILVVAKWSIIWWLCGIVWPEHHTAFFWLLAVLAAKVGDKE